MIGGYGYEEMECKQTCKRKHVMRMKNDKYKWRGEGGSKMRNRRENIKAARDQTRSQDKNIQKIRMRSTRKSNNKHMETMQNREGLGGSRKATAQIESHSRGCGKVVISKINDFQLNMTAAGMHLALALATSRSFLHIGE